MSRRTMRRRVSRPDRQATPAPVAPTTEARIREVSSGGRAIEEGARRWFEGRTGATLGEARLHDDPAASQLAQSVGARAFTRANHVFFGPGANDMGSAGGRRLIAHELAHVAQHGAGGPADVVHRQPQPAAPPKPNKVTLNFNQAIPVPPTGTRTFKATADVAGVTWSLTPGTTTAASGTAISATGEITIGAKQTAGTVNARATNSAGDWAEQPFRFAGIPAGITSTSLVSDPTGANLYGHVFDHIFTSSTGTVADLQGVAVGEKFPGLATPEAADHVIAPPAYPFGGNFTLHTATLTPNASNNWFLTASGGLGGSFDTVSIGRGGIDVGRFVQSASNPTPAGRLPAGFSVDQHLHWYNPLVDDGAKRWTDFATVVHSRFLTNSSGTIAFETTVNGVSDGGDTYVGKPAVTNLTASPIDTPKSAGPPAAGGKAPPARTVSLTVDTLSSTLGTGQSLRWSIQGAALGCTVAANAGNPAAVTLTIGTTTGTVTVRVADASGTNFDEVQVRIT